MTLTDIERRTDSESAAQALYDDASITVTKLGENIGAKVEGCLLYTSPSPRDRTRSRMPSSA